MTNYMTLLPPLCHGCTQRAHNCQKWEKKSIFSSCLCHKIYRVEAVGLYFNNYTFESTTFVSMWNLGQFRENLIFWK